MRQTRETTGKQTFQQTEGDIRVCAIERRAGERETEKVIDMQKEGEFKRARYCRSTETKRGDYPDRMSIHEHREKEKKTERERDIYGKHYKYIPGHTADMKHTTNT